MSSTAGSGSLQSDGPAHGPADRLGLKPGMVVQELGWDYDTDDELRVAIEDAIDADMVDGDYGNVVDAVLLWWRDDDGDLVDALVDSLTDLVGGGAIWLLTPKVGRPNAVDPADIAEAAPDRGPLPDDDRRRQQGLVGHPAGRAQDSPPDPEGHPAVNPSLMLTRATAAATGLKVLAGSGIIRPYSPGRPSPGWSAPSAAWGTGPAGGFAALAVRSPDRVGLIDELGPLTFGEIHQRSNALAHALAERGVDGGRRGRGHVPQPPRLRRRLGRRRQARRRHPLPQHRLRRPAAGRGARARAAVGGDPRRGVHRPDRGKADVEQRADRLDRRPGRPSTEHDRAR